MVNTLELYNMYRKVPDEAKKPIRGGRLNGMTDINPMWRIKCLTEFFGPAGIGWGAQMVNEPTYRENPETGEVACFVEILLWYKLGDQRGEIYGYGGSMFISKEKNGLYTDDECEKKAYTDAISVACKSLGIGADVYWEKDSTKYTTREEPAEPETKAEITPEPATCPVCGQQTYEVVTGTKGTQIYPKDFIQRYGMCPECYRKKKAEAAKNEANAAG